LEVLTPAFVATESAEAAALEVPLAELFHLKQFQQSDTLNATLCRSSLAPCPSAYSVSD
jgi:hypothetical protein